MTEISVHAQSRNSHPVFTDGGLRAVEGRPQAFIVSLHFKRERGPLSGLDCP